MISKFIFAAAMSLSGVAVHAEGAFDFWPTVPGTKFFTLFNDRNSDANDFYYSATPQGAVTGFDYLTTNGDKSFSLDDISSPDGVVLEEQQGIKAVIVLGNISNGTGRGQLTFRYVSNGLSGTYSDCTVNFSRMRNGSWALLDASGKVIHSAKLITWSMGIKTIQGICQ